MRHHFTPTRIAISKRQTVRTEDMKKLKRLYFADRNVKSCFRKQLNTELSYGIALTLLGI